jgi:hypothetical protein
MFEKPADQSLSGDRAELWVQVLSADVVPLQAVKEAMTPQQRSVFARYADKPISFYPHFVTAEERAEHGFRFDDTWAFPEIGA